MAVVMMRRFDGHRNKGEGRWGEEVKRKRMKKRRRARSFKAGSDTPNIQNTKSDLFSIERYPPTLDIYQGTCKQSLEDLVASSSFEACKLLNDYLSKPASNITLFVCLARSFDGLESN